QICPKTGERPQMRPQNREISASCPKEASPQPSDGHLGEAEAVDQTFLKKNLGFRAIRELLPGTAFMPGSSGGWVEVSWALQGRSIVGSPPLFHVT
ncbi:MAG: hypothetical protein Q8O82_01405, partial [Pseudorhodobacter sp.]|nr:hypothetical protein [Pseudorhodobacter sp.]